MTATPALYGAGQSVKVNAVETTGAGSVSDKMTQAKWDKIVAEMLAEWHRVDSGHEMRRYAVLWWDDRKGMLVHWYNDLIHAYGRKDMLVRGSFVTIVDWKAERDRKAQEAA